jgi:hypothetical protein
LAFADASRVGKAMTVQSQISSRDAAATLETLNDENALRTRVRQSRSLVRPVSRVWFELSDKSAFDDCIQRSVEWMAQRPRKYSPPRSGVDLPPEAWNGEAFDITDVLGSNPAKAFRVEAADGALWVARLDWPDPDHPRTWVSEFFVERRIGELTRFGAQLTCVEREPCPAFETTRPTVVRKVLETLSAEADNRPLADVVPILETPDVVDLIELLYEPTRRLPVIVISTHGDRSTPISPNLMAKRVAGAAHVIHVSQDASWAMTRTLGRRMSVFNGATRLYMPGLTEENEDPHQHPLWMHPTGDATSFVNLLAGRVLPAAFLREGIDQPFHRYSTVRDIVARQQLTHSARADASSQQSLGLELLELEKAEVSEDRDFWQALALEEEDRRRDAENELERLKEEVARLTAKAASLKFRLSEQSDACDSVEPEPDSPLESYDGLEEWAEKTLRDKVYIHQAALKDCRKNGHAKMLGRIESALLIMRDYLAPARETNDRALAEAGRQKLTEHGMEDSACFVDREEAKRTPQYSVQYEGSSRVLYEHIKYGNGYDNSNQIRIYYFWDENNSRIVVGKMPSHLRNNMTN